jgi:hypothetical protein
MVRQQYDKLRPDRDANGFRRSACSPHRASADLALRDQSRASSDVAGLAAATAALSDASLYVAIASRPATKRDDLPNYEIRLAEGRGYRKWQLRAVPVNAGSSPGAESGPGLAAQSRPSQPAAAGSTRTWAIARLLRESEVRTGLRRGQRASLITPPATR